MTLAQEGFSSLLRERLRSISPFHDPLYEPEYGENIFDFVGSETTLRFHGAGLGDLMIIRQVGQAFNDLLRDDGDPGLGDIVIATGGFEPAFNADSGDINCFWWWSLGPFDDSPEDFFPTYVEEAATDPDLVLCPSERCRTVAEEHGYRTLYLPLGTYAFEPLGIEREGLGYAGSRGHKSEQQIKSLFGPYIDDDAFEWVDHFVTPAQLNLWYNSKEVLFGLTREGQRDFGMVNNRVFETLASGTPLLLEPHENVEQVLGFEYPYQPESVDESQEIIRELRVDYESTRSEFERIAETVRQEHSYRCRLTTLFDEVREMSG